MTNEFVGTEEEMWKKGDAEDVLLQECKNYLRCGWPDKKRLSEEFIVFHKIKDELEIENELLFKNGETLTGCGVENEYHVRNDVEDVRSDEVSYHDDVSVESDTVLNRDSEMLTMPKGIGAVEDYLRFLQMELKQQQKEKKAL
ncbi:hypothetical protein NDU88_001507 [Pleurodeles waltl]|uniref:Uncharacterized protein n=1 Tax=Pleurodeles waltl TaxID=8319 RepID=A0AAV7VZP9_PLEWA|nr:hypothetical protein NDU88_001507 [Pleurodeles waltl]